MRLARAAAILDRTLYWGVEKRCDGPGNERTGHESVPLATGRILQRGGRVSPARRANRELFVRIFAVFLE